MPGALPPNPEYDHTDWWTKLLGGTTCVSEGGTPAPLVLRDGLVQLWLYFKAEEICDCELTITPWLRAADED